MNKILYIILISFIVSNCSFKPVVKHHGVPFLENFEEIDDLIDYFNKFKENLSKKTLNSYLKSVSNQ